ncbi:hypothetical protein TNCV_1390251 [Trichonephila clavipes]|nr:hypothetical protein TNCV_1390251 [Trichonephila clavipes]
MTMSGSSFPPTPLGHEDNLEVRHHPRANTLQEKLELGKTPIETYAMRVRVHEDNLSKGDISMKCVHKGIERESASDKTHSGRSVTSISDENIEKVRKLITKAVRKIADEPQIKREFGRQIVIQYLGMRKTWRDT